MDELDYRILTRLDENSRDSYQKIAADFSVSKKTVERRIKTLTSNGIIKSFEILFNLSELSLSEAVFYLKLENRFATTGLHDSILSIKGVYEIMVFGGGSALAFVIFKLEDELSNIIARIQSMDGIIDLDYEIIVPHGETGKLTLEDWRLIEFLNHNARAEVAEIAGNISKSTKTVQRRIRYLNETGRIRFGIQIDLSKARGLLPYLILAKIKAGVDKYNLYLRIKADVPSVWRKIMGSNPTLLTVVSYAEMLSDLNEDVEKISRIEGVSGVNVLFNVSDEVNNSWLDREIKMRAI